MPAVSASEFWIGALYNAGTPYNSFKGKIDDVRVYDRALTQSEIYHHYANYHPPDTLKVTENNLRVTLDWNYDTIRHPVKYYIYRDRMSPAVTLYDSVEIVNNSDTYYVDDNIESDTTYYYRITSVDPLGYESWFSDEVSITSYHPSVSDYNGNVYNTLRAGNQIWLQQNLLSTHYADGTILEDGSSIGDITGNYSSQYQFAFDDDDANTLIYGRLYTWAAAMRGATSSDDNPGTTQGVCPDGWHMPTDSEWKEFELQLGMSEGLINKMYNRGIDAGGRIKLDSTKYWLEPNLAATNSSGYTALPAGYRPPIGGFNHLKAYGYFWTATQEDISNAYLRGLHYNSAGIIRNRLDKAMAFSVRCLQNFSPLDDGLVAHYPFSGSPFDVSGNGNNGIITNAELSTDRFNNAISAYSFNGIDAGINFGHNSSQQFTNQLSLVAWVNPSELKSLEQMVISKWGDVDESFYLAIDNTGNPFGKIRFTDSQEVTITSNTDLPLNNWSMITMTYDGDSVYLYVNDTKTFSVLETRDIHSGTLDLIIANDNTGNLPFKGSIDDVRVYNRSLTALEIDSLYYENSWDIADIGTFTINEQTRETKIDKAAGTVLIEVAYGTEVTGLVPTFTLSPDASAKIGTDPQTSGVSTIDFTNPVIYTITATDGTTKDWEVTVGKTIEDFDNNIYSVVKIGYKTWMAENLRSTHYADGSQLIDGTGAGNISGDVSKYYFNYDDDVANVRNNGRLYTWSAVMNGATSSDLNESGIQGVCPTGWHLPSDSEFKYLETYLGMSPSDADLTDWRGSDEGGRLKGTTEWLQPNIGATDEYDFNMLPTGYRSVAGSFCCIDGYGNLWSSTESSESLAGIRSFVYSGARIARWDYHKSDAFAVRCVLDLKAEILSFALPDGTAPGTIDQINHIVDIEVVFGTLLTALTPTFSLSSESFATVDGNLQESGISTNNYSSSVIYTVTAEDGSTTDWTVNVTVALGAEKDILSFRINDIDGVLGTDTVTLELPYGEARSALTPVIIVSDSATITPDSGIVQDFSNPVTYTVIAEDGTTKSWVIIVTNGLNSATDIATFVLNEQTEPANIDAVNHTVSLEVAYGTDFSSLIPVFTSSFGSTLLVDGIVQTSSVSDRDFTNPVIYTVLAENGVTSQEWTVTIIEQADTEGPEIIHVNIPPTIYNVGTDSLVVSVIVTDNFELSKVTFNSRRPYSTAFTKEEYNPLSADNNYSKTLKEGREVTEEGLEYFFSAEDASGNISSTDTILMVFQYTNSGPFIPNLGYGGKAEDWRMFSIPYELSNNSIAAIFERELGAYDIFEWRLFHYQNDRFVENNDGLNAIERGKSYWFNSLNKVDIPVYPAKTPGNTQDNPFVIQLEPGWNQIGNPYLFDVAWADVINYPANTSIKVADHIRVQTD
ncbi:MAG: FISUMP domain-containing protein, partial [Bacteroidota bacterium]